MDKKYPVRGGDCEYTEDCMWGVDGWCDRPEGRKCVAEEMYDREKNTTTANKATKQ